MIITSLEDHPPFEALSYTWGDPTEKHTISCEGKLIQVTRNLWQALHRLRLPDTPRTFWIDAICINQGDIEERTSQVLLMDTIYWEAYIVVAWLGEATQDSPAAFELMRRIYAIADTTPQSDLAKPLPESDLEANGLPNKYSSDWKALDAIFWRPWFTRIWIVQEITVAKRAAVLCGEDSILWPNLVVVANYIYWRSVNVLTGVDPTRVMPLHQLRYWSPPGEEMSLLTLLIGFRRSLSTNPVDKVYALLGLATGSANPAIIPDYKLSPADVFQDVAVGFLLKSLDILSVVGDPGWKMIYSMPSWVPDWSGQLREHAYLFSNYGHSLNACGNTSPLVRFSADCKTLYAQGVILDRVSSFNRTFASHGIRNPKSWGVQIIGQNYLEDAFLALLSIRFRFGERMVFRLKHYPTGEDVESVYHKTLIGNADIGQNSASGKSLAEMYAAFRRKWALLPGESAGIDKDTEETVAAVYARAVWAASYGRKIFITKGGYVGLGPASTHRNDCIVFLCGGRTAYILRKLKNKEAFTFLGEAYVHGTMNGEVFEKDHTLKEFPIK
jgi:Heterokaryon incompatibility protein (HET)